MLTCLGAAKAAVLKRRHSYTESVTASVAFALRPRKDLGDVVEVVPVVAGIELTGRIHQFELQHGMETRPLSYGGLIPAFFRFGPAEVHYLGRDGAFGSDDGKVPLLGCECGEWGCWPLRARVIVGDETVTWTDFEQPYRKERDYSGFGPFVFDRHEYESAISDIAVEWAAASD